jgi:hypothetical protein
MAGKITGRRHLLIKLTLAAAPAREFDPLVIPSVPAYTENGRRGTIRG